MVAVAEHSGADKKPQIERKGRKSASPTWSIQQELAIRSMYLTQGLNPKTIAESLGIDVLKVYRLVTARKWTQERAQKIARIEAASDSSSEEHIRRVVEATATLAEEGLAKGLRNAIDVANTPGAKGAARDYAAWTSGARNLMQIARTQRGMDAKENAAPQVNVSFFGANRVSINAVPSAPAQAPAVEVSASVVK